MVRMATETFVFAFAGGFLGAALPLAVGAYWVKGKAEAVVEEMNSGLLGGLGGSDGLGLEVDDPHGTHRDANVTDTGSVHEIDWGDEDGS